MVSEPFVNISFNFTNTILEKSLNYCHERLGIQALVIVVLVLVLAGTQLYYLRKISKLKKVNNDNNEQNKQWEL